MSLTENSTSLTVAENSLATAILIPTPNDTNYTSAQLTVKVTTLPADGTILLADGVTALTVGETLTVAQLVGLELKPAPNSSGQTSGFEFSVSDPGGNTATATIALPSSNTPSTAMPLNIGVPSKAASAVVIEITKLPTNGTVVLSDGTPVSVGQNLTLAQLSGLRFQPNPDAVPQSSILGRNEATAGGATTLMSIALPFDASAPTITPSVTPAPTDPAASTPTLAPNASSATSDLATPAVTSATSDSANLTTTATPATSPTLAVTAASGDPPALTPAAAPTDPSAPAAVPPAGPKKDTPGDYNSVFGKALNIDVPSEALSSTLTIEVTGLPTNGKKVVRSDGSTQVNVGDTLTPAEAAGLRFKGNGNGQSSHFDYDEVLPGRPHTPKTIDIPGDDSTDAVAPTAATASPTTAAPTTAAPMSAAPSNPNPIVLENEKPGTPQSVWQISPGQDSTEIQGFTTSISTPLGGTVQFKINNQTGNGTYQIQIYRLGYYGGDGATLVTTLNHSGSPIVQPNPLTDPTTGEVDAGNWSVTDSWAVPSNATSGVYIANVIDGSQIFQIPFVITNPTSTSDIVFQTSDETWQAYNGYGGANLYGGNGPANPPPPASGQGAAFAVSYNRPFVTRDSIGTYAGPQDFLFGAEYAAIYWLEQNGYDVSYISGIDTATNGSLLLNHKVFMDAGHDEYWTDAQVANVQAAANAGVNLAFLSGNEIFWQTRLSPSIDSSADPNRTLVTYKDTHFNQEIDPSGKDTGTFEDPRLGSPPMPSNEVTGTFFQVDQTSDTLGITVPYWRDTTALLAQHQRRANGTRSDGIIGRGPPRLRMGFIAGQSLHTGRPH